ncbi:MAG: PD-(D/E)XK nuclease family protein [Luteibaculaceae bacterium]
MRFLETCALELLQSETRLADKTIIVPSKRAGGFLQRALLKNAPKPIVLPEIIDLNSFIFRQSGLEKIDSTSSVLELYEVYTKLNNSNLGFEHFYNWAPSFLADINQLALHEIKASDFFTNLVNIKEIDFWSFQVGEEQLSRNQKAFNQFWGSLLPLHDSFVPHLLNKGLAFPGLALSELNASLPSLMNTFKKNSLIFLGLNALSQGELTLFRSLAEKDIAELWLQTDDYILQHEAGKFQRKIAQEKGVRIFKNATHHNLIPKKMTEFGAKGYHVSVSAVCNLLSTFSQEELNNTALVLMDESMMLPILNHLPKNIKTYNISIGIKLAQLPAGKFLSVYFNLIDESFFGEGDELYFKVSLLKECLESEFLQSFYPTKVSQNKKLLEQGYISYTQLLGLEPELSLVLPNFGNKQLALRLYLDDLLTKFNAFESLLDKHINPFVLESFYMAKKALMQFSKGLGTFNEQIQFKTFHRIFKKFMAEPSLTVIGEPFTGLQIFGLLETRALDFEHVVLVGANESELPGVNFENTLAPYDLVRYFKLPDVEHKEALVAYYFFRLTSYATTLYVFYESGSAAMGAVEKSRFLLQIAEELPNVEINRRDVVVETNAGKLEEKEDLASITDEQVKYFLEHNLHEASLSASKVRDAFFRGKNFYDTFYCGISLDEINTQLLPPNSMGNLIHDVLEELYKPLAGTVLTKESVENLLHKLDTQLAASLKKTFGNAMQAETLLRKSIAENQLQNFIKADATRVAKSKVPITLLSVEEDVNSLYRFSVPFLDNSQYEIKLKGKIDRVEKQGDTIILIDYKTGAFDKKEIKDDFDWDKFESLFPFTVGDTGFQLEKKPQVPEYILQGIFYHYMYCTGKKIAYDNCKFQLWFLLKNNPLETETLNFYKDYQAFFRQLVDWVFQLRAFKNF